MCKKITLAMMIVSIYAVPAMADVVGNLSWNSPTPNVNVLWASQAGGIWTGAQAAVIVQGAGTSAYGTVTFNTTNDIQPVATSSAVFVGGTYEALASYSVDGGIFDATNYSYSKFELVNPWNAGAVIQGFNANQPVETTGGQNVSTVGGPAVHLTMQQGVSGDTIGTISFQGEAYGSVHGYAEQELDLLPGQYGYMGFQLAGTFGTTVWDFVPDASPNPLTVYVYPDASFSGTGPMGYGYTTDPDYSVAGWATIN
jgi:hypothetical protein